MRRNLGILMMVGLAASVTAAYTQTPASPPASSGTDVAHAVAGTISKVDEAAKTVTIKTARGTSEVLKFSEKTIVEAAEATGRGVEGTAGAVKRGAGATLSAAKEGTDAVVHYVRRGSDKVATAVHEVGKGSLKVAEGVVSGVDAGAKTMTVKTKDGAEQVFHLGEKAGVETGRGVAKAAETTGHGLKTGEQVTVHFTEATGRKVAHLVAHATAPAKK